MKKAKTLIPSFIMLMLSASLMGTSTYAWFSMNREVQALGMQIQAEAEDGLVISNSATGTYNETATTTQTGAKALRPGSTSDLTNWYHSTSSDPANENTGEPYTAGTAWDSTDGGNYIVHDFYIRSSGATTITVASLDVKEVTAKIADTDPATSAAQVLSKSLRVGVKIGSQYFIYAPVSGFTSTYNVWNGSAQTTSVSPLSSTTVSHATGTTSIPANTANGTLVQIYIWFEGEDENCISNNILAVLETLEVNVTFTYTQN